MLLCKRCDGIIESDPKEWSVDKWDLALVMMNFITVRTTQWWKEMLYNILSSFSKENAYQKTNTTSFFFLFIFFFNFEILYCFCHISKWICHRYTCVPHPEPSSLLPLHTIPLGRPRAPTPSIPYCASNLDWRLVSYMILYMFQCHSPKSYHPLPLPQSTKDWSIHPCLFSCLVYKVIVTIFLNSIYMR